MNSLRAAVERAISHLVNWKILDLGYRGRLTELRGSGSTVGRLWSQLLLPSGFTFWFSWMALGDRQAGASSTVAGVVAARARRRRMWRRCSQM
ncbi:hypothetical protein DMB66_58555 [Actinoplanes sp. ATCC 53533]|nr:hypothetical protein DMB66_58555 [Actinoplanes sp. ATCC 53533]